MWTWPIFFPPNIRAREQVNIEEKEAQGRTGVAVRISTLCQAWRRRQGYFWWARPNLVNWPLVLTFALLAVVWNKCWLNRTLPGLVLFHISFTSHLKTKLSAILISVRLHIRHVSVGERECCSYSNTESLEQRIVIIGAELKVLKGDPNVSQRQEQQKQLPSPWAAMCNLEVQEGAAHSWDQSLSEGKWLVLEADTSRVQWSWMGECVKTANGIQLLCKGSAPAGEIPATRGSPSLVPPVGRA